MSKISNYWAMNIAKQAGIGAIFVSIIAVQF